MLRQAATTLLLLMAAPVFAASAASTATAVPVPATASHVDNAAGALGSEMWDGVPGVSEFVQREPTEGGAPSQKTEFKVAYTSSTLFVKVRAFDTEPDKIRGFLSRRDGDSPADWIHVMIDSYHDRRTAYEFAVNPSGVKRDRYWYNDNNSDDSWDAIWDVTVTRDSLGWEAEFRIPFSQLRFNPDNSNTFGLAVTREIARLKETSTWPLLARSANGYVSSFGELNGLSMSRSTKKLEVSPYGLANFTKQPTSGNPLVDAAGVSGAAGADLKYALTPGLTLTGTINPDFGQVEADPAVVNLTAFETYFNERRPFFVEGSGNFRFETDCDGSCSGLFYSRRIGRSPQGTDNLPGDDGTFTSSTGQTTIYGAAKLTGRVGKFSIGGLHALTQEEFAKVLVGPKEYKQPIEPLTDYSVGRIRREFANNSSFGFIMTATNRHLPSELSFLPDAAYTGGVDADLRFKSFYSLSGFWAGSHVTGTPEAIERLQEDPTHYYQRPDSPVAFDPARTSLSGDAGQIAFSKIGGQRVRGNFNLSHRSPGYDTNDIGYMRRADQTATNGWLQIRSDKPSRFLRTRNINFNQWSKWNANGDRLEMGGNVNSHALFTNNWEIGGGFNKNADTIDDRVTRGGPTVLIDGETSGWYYVNSDTRKPVSFTYNGSYGNSGHGTRNWDGAPSVTFRPIQSLNIQAGVHYTKYLNDAQWVDTVTDTKDHSVFGHLDQSTVSLTARVNYTITPDLSVQIYAAPFLSGGAYSGFKELNAPLDPNYDLRYKPFAYTGEPDFNYRSFRTTNVMRWEYRPGSTLFVVWQQNRDETITTSQFNFRDDFRDTFRIAGTNVFLVKLAYWLNY